MGNRFAALLFFYYSQYCILFSFTAVFFKEQGFTEGQIGKLAAVSGLAVILAGPLAGRTADRKGEKWVSVVCLSLTILFAALLYRQRQAFWPVLLLYGGVSVFDKAAGPLLDNWVFHRALEDGRINYGLSRGAGSLGSALCAAGTGALIAGAGFGAAFLLHALLTAAACILVLLAPQNERTKEASRTEEKTGGKTLGQLFHNRRYPVLLLVSALLFLGVTTEITFYPVLFMQRGGSTGLLGLSLFLMSVSEMCGMACYRKLNRRFTAEGLLLSAILFYIVKLACQLWSGHVAGLMLVQLLQGATYGLFLPSAVALVTEFVPPGMSATGMSLCAVCFNGVGVVLGNWLAGSISEHYGLQQAYLMAVLLCMLAAAICTAGLWKPSKRRTQNNYDREKRI